MTKKRKVKKQGVGKSKNAKQKGVGPEKRNQSAPNKETAPQPNPTSAPIPAQRAQTSGIRATVRVLCVIATFAISLIVFWPKASLSMVNRDDPMVWLFLIKNDSFFPIWDATKQSKVELLVRPHGIELAGPVKLTQDDCEPETLPKLRPGDEHTFKCHVFGIKSGATVVEGNVNLRVKIGIWVSSVRLRLLVSSSSRREKMLRISGSDAPAPSLSPLKLVWQIEDAIASRPARVERLEGSPDINEMKWSC